MTHALDKLLRPRSIAIAGVSENASKLGSLPLSFLRKFGYPGDVYPIHPKLDEVQGIRCHRSLASVGRPIDMVIVAIGADRVPALLDECEQGQVGYALVLSSNYAEAGADGERAQRELVDLAHRKGMRIVGPNSVGIVNLWDKSVASISQVFDRTDLAPGSIAFVTQSGAVGTAITALAREQGLGVGYFVSSGNEADVEFSDFCDAFVDDPRVAVIAGYLESVRDGAKFQRVARRALEHGKPIVVVKVGTTDVGGRAVRSHTGALAGADAVYDAVFAAHGVVRADSVEALLDRLKMFAAYPDARDAGSDRVAVLSHSGGAGVMMADAAVELGLSMPPPSTALRETLRARLPAYAAIDNPVDMTANVVFDPSAIAGTMHDVAQSGEYDAAALCVNLIWRHGDALADALASVRQATPAMLGVAWIAAMASPLQRLAQARVPVFGDPVRCVRAVAARLRWDRTRAAALRESRVDVSPAACASPPERYGDCQRMLESHAIDVAPGGLVGDVGGATRLARELGYPVVAKLVAPSLPHKSDAGAVRLDIADHAALKQSVVDLLAIPCADREGVLVQKMIVDADAIELFAGFTRDPVFGPIVVFGLGGIYVEMLRDVVMRPAPFDVETALRMIGGARFAAALHGARGRSRCDVDALARALAALSTLAIEQPAIASIDLNPLLARPHGAVVLDFKVEVAPR